MIALGVDPGYGILGYGILKESDRNISVLTYGSLKTPKSERFSQRLKMIYEELEKLLNNHHIDVIVMEKLYFVRNVTTGLKVAEVRGVIRLVGEQRSIPIYECSPQDVKVSVTGYGQATKKQIQYMITKLLNLDKIPKPDDVADALAIAWCFLNSRR